MLTRGRERILVLVGLVALNLGFGWILSHYRKDYRSRTQWIYAQTPTQPAAPEGAPRTPVTAQTFADIVNRTIFSPSRTNQAPVESVKPPELPLLYGTMNLGDGMFAMMAPANQTNGLSKPVHPGEEIGGYKLVSIGDSQVVVAWEEKQFTVNVWESARKVPRIVEKPAPTAPSTQPAPASSSTGTASHVTTAGASSGAARELDEYKKKFTPAGFNAPPGAPVDAPAGTVLGGKRKVVRQTMFGPSVFWEDVEQPKNPPGPENPK